MEYPTIGVSRLPRFMGIGNRFDSRYLPLQIKRNSMSWFNFRRKPPTPPPPPSFVGQKYPLDSTIARKPIWLQLNSAKSWTADQTKYKGSIQTYLTSIAVGVKDNAGYQVTNVLSRGDEFVIYEVLTASGTYAIRIDIRSYVEEDDIMVIRWSEVAREYYITKRVLFKVNDHSTRERIGNIISRALSTGYSSEAVHDLKELQIQINEIYSERIQNSLKYLGTIIFITLSFVAYSLYTYREACYLDQNTFRLLIFASTAGCIGGFFSVSIRLRQMTFEREIPSWTYVLYGFERVVVSIFGAIIALLAIKTGLAFNVATSSTFGILLVAVAAGFSETLIPNLLVKIESEKK